MAEQPSAPELKKTIPPLVVNEGAALPPLDLNQFIQSPNADSGAVTFEAALPADLTCSREGIVSGTPKLGAAGHYFVQVTARNASSVAFMANLDVTIMPQLSTDDPLFSVNLKSRVWEALGQNLPLPDVGAILNRPVSPLEVYYLLQRWATLAIWDVYNLDYPGEKVLIHLPDESPHYNIYDCGSCLIAAPKDLFSYKRTLEDALQSARVIAREVYKRGWTIEFAGFNKMVRAAWVELQLLGDQHKKQIEILHYSPSPEDMRLYTSRAESKGPQIS